jgi:GAF domain-containing protein
MIYIRRFFSVQHEYINRVDRQRAAGLLAINAVTLLLWLAWMTLVVGQAALGSSDEADALDLNIFVFAFPVVIIGVNWLIHRGMLMAASWIFVVFFYPIVALPVADQLNGIATFALILPTTAAGILLDRRGITFALVIDALIVALIALNQSRLDEAVSTIPADSVASELFAVGSIFAVVGGLLYIFSTKGRSAESFTAESLTTMEQFRQLNQFIAHTAYTDPDLIYRKMLQFTQREMGFHFAQLFFVDSGGELSRRLRSGIGAFSGRTDVETTIGDANALKEALQTGAIVYVDTSDHTLRRTHFLPSSQFGVAIPLKDEGRVVAILDVQRNEEPFTAFHVDMLTTLVDQVGVKVRDVQTINVIRELLSEQTARIESLRAQLEAYRQLEQEAISDVWETYVERRGQDILGFDIDAETHMMIPASEAAVDFPPEAASGEIVVEKVEDGQRIFAPIRLRNETLGIMTFTIPTLVPLATRQLDMMRKVTDQLAVALDNKRLFEQSQAQALRERKASEVGGSLLSATDIDMILSMAAERFNETLGAVSTRIHLHPDALTKAQIEPKKLNGGGAS